MLPDPWGKCLGAVQAQCQVLQGGGTDVATDTDITNVWYPTAHHLLLPLSRTAYQKQPKHDSKIIAGRKT